MMKTIRSAQQLVLVTTGVLMLIMTNQETFAASGSAPSYEPMDMIFVVEDSTTMKQRDPDGSHKLAIKMLLSLLNNNDRAALVSFNNTAEIQSEMLRLETDAITNQFFNHIDRFSGVQTSVDLHQALQATKQLIENSQPAEERDIHVVLFTSGQATNGKHDDLTTEDKKDESISQLLLWFKTAVIPVHVVTFSHTANEPMVKNITASTHGTLTITESGQPLKSAVLGLGRSLSSENIVYIEDEPTWQVDNSMNYFKLLIRPGAASISLIAPNEKKIEVTSKTAGISLRSTDDFTAITVSEPDPGTWQIKSDNLAQHKIVAQYASVIGLGYTLQRDVIKAGEKIKLSAWLMKNNEPATDSDIVQFLKVRLKIFRDKTIIDDSSLFPDPESPNRFFTYIQLDEAGSYDFQITMEDNNLYREARFNRVIGSAQSAQVVQQPQASTPPEVAEKAAPPKPARDSASPASDTDSSAVTLLSGDLAHLNEALVIAVIFNALLIVIGGLIYYRRKMNQQSINTLELMKYGNGKKDRKQGLPFNNAAA